MTKPAPSATKIWNKPTLSKFTLSESEAQLSTNTADGSVSGGTTFTS